MSDFGHEIQPGQIVIKDTDVLLGLMERRFAPILVLIILQVAKQFGIIITESYREKRHMNDLHGFLPVRAIDLRYWCYSENLAYEIRNHINSRWVYDPSRPIKKVATIHKVKGGAMHFHIQVHPNTRRSAY